MERPRAEYLFQKWVQQQCTAAEKAALLALLETDETGIQQLLDEYIEKREEKPLLSDEAAEGILTAVFQAEDQAVKVVPMPVAARKTGRWLWWSAAVMIPAAVVGWLLWNKPAAEPEKTTAQTQVQPGSDKAVLVLESGEEIALEGGKEQKGDVPEGQGFVIMEQGVLKYRNIPAAVPDGMHTLRTPRGGKFQLLLPDGTHVWLNAASTLRFPTAFTGRERRVELNGEAYFDVAANAGSAFYVKADSMQVNVLGTGFNVMAYPEEGPAKTTLVQGSLQVKQGHSAVVLKPGQQAEPKADGKLQVKDADLEVALAWKEDKFRFRDADIKTIMRQVARWYNIQVSYEGEVRGRRLSGMVMRSSGIKDMLDVLEEAGNVHFLLEDDKVTVLEGKNR